MLPKKMLGTKMQEDKDLLRIAFYAGRTLSNYRTEYIEVFMEDDYTTPKYEEFDCWYDKFFGDSVLVDTLHFSPALDIDYETVMGMFTSHHQQKGDESHSLYIDEEEFNFLKQYIKKVDKIEILGLHARGIDFVLFEGEKSFSIFAEGRGSNSPYYGNNIDLNINLPNGDFRKHDVSEYQSICIE